MDKASDFGTRGLEFEPSECFKHLKIIVTCVHHEHQTQSGEKVRIPALYRGSGVNMPIHTCRWRICGDMNALTVTKSLLFSLSRCAGD